MRIMGITMKRAYLALLVLPLSTAYADGNTTIQSLNKAKKALEPEVYHDHRETIYCAASFDAKKNIEPPAGFTTDKHVNAQKGLSGNTWFRRKTSGVLMWSGVKGMQNV